MTIEAAFWGTVAKDTEPKISTKGKPWIRITMRVGDGDDAQAHTRPSLKAKNPAVTTRRGFLSLCAASHDAAYLVAFGDACETSTRRY